MSGIQTPLHAKLLSVLYLKSAQNAAVLKNGSLPTSHISLRWRMREKGKATQQNKKESDQTCCVFQPVSECCSLVEIIFFSISTSFSITNRKKEKKKKRKKEKNTWKRGPTSIKVLLLNAGWHPNTCKLLSDNISNLCFFASTLIRWDKSAAIQELFSFLGIGTKQATLHNYLNKNICVYHCAF